jgi:hypothetical protein
MWGRRKFLHSLGALHQPGLVAFVFRLRSSRLKYRAKLGVLEGHLVRGRLCFLRIEILRVFLASWGDLIEVSWSFWVRSFISAFGDLYFFGVLYPELATVLGVSGMVKGETLSTAGDPIMTMLECLVLFAD